MKRNLIAATSFVLAVLSAKAQCPNDNTLTPGSLTPPAVSQTTSLTFNTGQYVLATVVSGATYTISTCNNTTTDTQISVYDDITGTYIAYNDDFCNLQSELQFTASSCSRIRIVLDQYPCTASNLPVLVSMTQNTAGTGILTVTPAITPASCGNNGAVTLAVSGGTGPYTFQWTPGNYTTSSVSNMAPGQYSVLVTDPGHCAQISVTVPNTGVSATLTTTPFSCVGGGSATASATGGGGQYSYLWTPGGQTTQTATGLGAGTYTCVVTDQNMCTYTGTCTVANNSPLQLTGAATPSTITCGGTTQLNATCNYTGTYTWAPAATVTNPNAQSTTATPTVTTTYTLTVNTSCGSSTQTVLVTVDTTNNFSEGLCLVTVDTASNHIRLVWANTMGFQNGTYDLYKETPASSGNYSLLTSLPANGPTTYLDLASNGATTAERYKIRTVTNCGNLSALSLQHRSIRLRVSPGSPGNWNLIWNHSEGFTFNVYNIWRGTSPGNMSLIATVQSNVQTYTDAGAPAGNLFYAIEALHPSGCTTSSPAVNYPSAWSNVEGTNPAGLNEQSLLRSVSIWPNPTHGEFVLSIESDRAEELTMEISDPLGRLVHRENIQVKTGMQQQTMQLMDLPKGVYFLKLSDTVSGTTSKLVIE